MLLIQDFRKGLPDGLFALQNSNYLVYIMNDVGMKNIGICCGRLKYFTAIL
jgi:hypothetical protein